MTGAVDAETDVGGVDEDDDEGLEEDSDFFGRRCFPSRVPMNKMTVDVVVVFIAVRMVWMGQCRVTKGVTIVVVGNAIAILRAPHIAMDKERIPTV